MVALILAAALGAWLGPAGERVDPSVGPSEAFFRYALQSRLVRELAPARVYLSVSGQDPPAALMIRFGGEVRPLSQLSGEGCQIDLARLEWLGSDSRVRCLGEVSQASHRESLSAEFVLSPSRKWVLQSSPQAR